MRQLCAVLTFATWAIAAIAEGAIFRWTDEQVIPGTENITPGPGVQLDRMMLEQADLRNFDLSGASFIESNLHRSFFSGSNLTNANFRGATVTNSGLRFANLNGANFREANLTLTGFGRSTLFGADFTDAVIIEGQFGSAEGFTANQLYSTASYKLKQLTATSFVGLDLSGWNFAGQDMTRMELWNTKLDGSDLSQAILYNTFLSHSSLVGANLRGADLRRAFVEANVTGADFTDAIVSEARLHYLANRGFTAEQLYSTASYKRKHLAGIDLTQNNMRGWNFSEQDLTDAFFTHSILECASFLNANLNSADLDGADLTGTDLTGALLVRASISGADFRSATGFQPDVTTFGKAILPDGTLRSIEQFELINVSDHDFGIVVTNGFDLSNGILSLKIEDGDWHSTIIVGPNITPKLDGTLSIYFSDEIGNLESLVGTTFDLFDWGQALDPANRFSEIYVPYPTSWDLSRLYDTGEVTLLAVPEPGTWVTLIVGVAACAVVASWRRRTRC